MIDDIDREEDDFLRYWDQQDAQAKPETQRILGVDVVVPTEFELRLQDLAQRLQASQDPADLARLVGMLFGKDTYEQWKENGLTTKMLPTLFSWGMANASGQPTTFEEAAALVAEAEAAKAKAEAEGKAVTAPNRAGRRAFSKTAGSAGTGRSSKQISHANTA